MLNVYRWLLAPRVFTLLIVLNKSRTTHHNKDSSRLSLDECFVVFDPCKQQSNALLHIQK